VHLCVRHIENNLVFCFLFVTDDRPVSKNRKWYLFSMRVEFDFVLVTAVYITH